MKKFVAIILALVMVLALAACGQSSAPAATPAESSAPAESRAAETAGIKLDGSWPEEKVKIGVIAFDTTDESFMGVMNYFDYLTKYFNVEFTVSEAIQSAEHEFQFIDSCAAAGCKGIFAYYNVAGAESIKHAMDQGLYYWGMAEFYEAVKSDPHFVGCYEFADPNNSGKNGDYLGGYELGYTMGKAGLNHIAFCNGGASFGVQMFIDRQQGFFDGIAKAQEEGSTTKFDPATDVIEGFPNDAYFAAQAAFFSADYDGVVSSFDAFTWFQPIIESGKDIKVGCIGTVSDTYKNFVDNGTVIALVYDCPEVVFGSAFADLMNAITGHNDLCVDKDGFALKNPTQRWTLNGSEDFNKVYNKHETEGSYFISADEMASILGAVNENATVDDVCAMFNKSLDDVK